MAESIIEEAYLAVFLVARKPQREFDFVSWLGIGLGSNDFFSQTASIVKLGIWPSSSEAVNESNPSSSGPNGVRKTAIRFD